MTNNNKSEKNVSRGNQRNKADKKGEDEERGPEDGKGIWS